MDFRAIFESAPGLHLVVEPDRPRYTIVAVSEACACMVASTRDEIAGRGFFDVFPDTDATLGAGVTASFERVLESRAPDEMPARKHAERVWRRVSSPVLGPHGDVAYIIHRLDDVTDAVRLAEIVQLAPDAILVVDRDGRCADANDAACRMLGFSREEIVETSVADFVPAEDADRLAQVERDLVAGAVRIGEWTLRRKDGHAVAVEMSAKSLTDGRWQVVAREITERKRVDDAVRLSEEKFSGIVSMAADAIISVDEEQRITLFNEGAEKTFGYSQWEAIGAPLEILIPDRYRAAHREQVARFAQGRQSARRMSERGRTIFGLRKNGEEFPADAAISKLDVGGKRILTVALRDVTDEARLEREQRLLAETGRVLVAAGVDHARLVTDIAELFVRESADWCIVATVERGKHQRLKVAHADPAKASACEALGRYLLEQGEQHTHLLSEALRTQASVVVSEVDAAYLEAIAAGGEHLDLLRALEPTSFVAVPLVARGQLVGALALGASRSTRRFGAREQREIEQLASCVAMAVDNARLHEAARRAVVVRDEVLGIVAHDLRSPLSSIVLQAGTLRRQGQEPERRSQKQADRIFRAAMRMNRLIQDLLDVKQLESGARLPIDERRLPVASVLAEVIEPQREMIAASGRELVVVAPSDLPDMWADRARIVQVLDNLVANAGKFSAPRGRITVGASAEERDVLFWVADEGPGISDADLAHVFDRFWRAKKVDRRGAGLGLFIVKGIVEAHGGRIWVESEPGLGSTFFFTIPTALAVEGRRGDGGPMSVKGRG